MGKIGVGLIVLGLALGIFYGVSNIMGNDNFWVTMTLSTFVGEGLSESIVNITQIAFIQDFLALILWDLPLFGFLIFLGSIVVIISLFFKNF